jgi:hypothetical protein
MFIATTIEESMSQIESYAPYYNSINNEIYKNYCDTTKLKVVFLYGDFIFKEETGSIKGLYYYIDNLINNLNKDHIETDVFINLYNRLQIIYKLIQNKEKNKQSTNDEDLLSSLKQFLIIIIQNFIIRLIKDNEINRMLLISKDHDPYNIKLNNNNKTLIDDNFQSQILKTINDAVNLLQPISYQVIIDIKSQLLNNIQTKLSIIENSSKPGNNESQDKTIRKTINNIDYTLSQILKQNNLLISQNPFYKFYNVNNSMDNNTKNKEYILDILNNKISGTQNEQITSDNLMKVDFSKEITFIKNLLSNGEQILITLDKNNKSNKFCNKSYIYIL